jgi:acylphosphatase
MTTEAGGRYLLFRGHVQGVGFRYTVRSVCCALGVRGWVRNLPDGSVEAQFFGETATLDRAIAQIREQRTSSIESPGFEYRRG